MSKYNRRLLRKSVQEQIESCKDQQRATMRLTPMSPHPEPSQTCFLIRIPGGKEGVIDLTNQPRLEASIDALPPEAFLGVATKKQVFDAIAMERDHQDEKWGLDKDQSLAGYLLIIESKLAEAKFGWMKDMPGEDAPLNQLVKVAAVCVAALERYGLTGNTFSTGDTPDPQPEQVERNS